MLRRKSAKNSQATFWTALANFNGGSFHEEQS